MLEILTDNETRLMAENEELKAKIDAVREWCNVNVNKAHKKDHMYLLAVVQVGWIVE